MTLPAATVLLDCRVTAPMVRPAAVMALVAAACVWPTTFGTAICAGPRETAGPTAEPAAPLSTLEPGVGIAWRARSAPYHPKKKKANGTPGSARPAAWL